ncbi:MAG: YiiX/YebB-like N1pC/P60 family cysteine hydrolase [Acidithiobacillus sp.]
MVRECGLTAYLLLREGIGVEARLVRLKKRGPWTHIGLIVGGILFESVPSTERTQGGVRIGHVKDFCAPERAVQVGYIPITLINPQCENLFHWCRRQVAQRVAFDDLYDLDNDQALYCSEFVYKAFQQIGVNLLTAELSCVSIPLVGTRKIIFPSDLVGLKSIFTNFSTLPL